MATATKDKKAAKKEQEEAKDHGPQVVKLKNGGSSWAEIAEKLGISQGKAQLAFLRENTPAEDRINAKNEADLAKRIVSARDKDKLSWGIISARSGVPESRCRKIYEEATGTSSRGNRIGRGGRFPSDEVRPAKAPKAPKAKTAKEAKEAKSDDTPAKVTAEQAKKPIGDMDLGELKARLNGKTITVNNEGGGSRRIAVKSVKALKDGEMRFADKDGKTITVLVAQIAKATR